MTTYAQLWGSGRALIAVVVTAAFGLGLLSGCKEVEETTATSGHVPATVEVIPNSSVKRVTIDEQGAEKIGLSTAVVERRGAQVVVPYAALIYDGAGLPWVYLNPDALSYVRARVLIDHVAGSQVMLAGGVRPGARVVTVGAAEVYGAELEIAGGH